jgi:hypothetical protein
MFPFSIRNIFVTFSGSGLSFDTNIDRRGRRRTQSCKTGKEKQKQAAVFVNP